MSFNERDRLTDLERQLQSLYADTRGIAYREGHAAQNLWLEFTAAGLIDAQGPGSKVNVLGMLGVKNDTGHPIWKGSRCVVWADPSDPRILFSDAAKVVALTYASGSALLVASYDLQQAADGGHFDDEDLDDSHFAVYDPSGLTTGIADNDIITFRTGGQGTSPYNTLTAVELVASGTASGGGALPWPDFPTTPDPTTGTTTVRMFRALVNATAGVASSDATFSFDGGTAQVGDEQASGTAVNKRPAAFVDNEPIEIIGAPGGTFYALKIGGNRIVAQVNGAPSGGLFALDNITALEGPAPHSSQTTGKVLSSQEWADNDWGLFELDDDKKWSGVKLNITASGAISLGLLVATVPAISGITYTTGPINVSVTPGTQDDAVILLTGAPGTLSESTLCRGVNYSKTAERGSLADPVVVSGQYFPAEGAEPAKFVIAPLDLRRLPNYDEDLDQAVFHAAEAPGFQLDGEDCG